jgi:RNA polymerase sigma-70 factor (ECF subfamily)
LVAGRGSKTPEPDDDARLAAGAKRDPAAFAALYRRYVDAVYRYCYHRMGTREQAEDATSHVFLKVLAGLPTRREDESFRSWLFAIAHNVVADLYRAKRPVWPLAVVAGHADSRSSIEEEALAAVEQDEVRALLLRLPVDQRRVLELRLAGLTSAEIAGVLGKQVGAVKMAQSRAIARLRRSLEGDLESANGSEEVTRVGP